MNCVYDKILHEPLKPKAHSCHGHNHDHDHAHDHDYKSVDKRVLKISFIITVVAMLVEIIYGFLSGSLALLSDGVHMFSHAFALGLSYFAIWISQKPADLNKTFGYHRAEVIVAFINALTIILTIIFIVYESIEKLINPEVIDIKSMLLAAIFGLIVNIITGWLLFKGDMENVNIKSSFIHMMTDLISSVAIIIGGVIIYYTNLYMIDTILAVMIAIVIAKWAYSLIIQSTSTLLEISPIDIAEVKNEVINSGLVLDIHDIHITEITHRMYVLTAHVVIKHENLNNFKEAVDKISHLLKDKFQIGHITLQPEWKSNNTKFWIK